MLVHPGFDPVALSLGPLQIHWYGLSYLAGFYLAWWLAVRRTRLAHVARQGWNRDQVGDLVFYTVLGVIAGGRIGYVLFYNFERFAADPIYLVQVWKGGMSFHGGLLGVLVAMAFFARKHRYHWWQVTDFLAVVVPAGLLTGRLGNFINAELYGRVTDMPWGMVFPQAGPEPRHPSQLYEAALEGVVMLVLLHWFAARPRPMMATSGLFLLLYGSFRTFVEFFRTPDAHIGFLAFDWLTMGMLLSAPMIVAGALIMLLAYRRNQLPPDAAAAVPEKSAKAAKSAKSAKRAQRAKGA